MSTLYFKCNRGSEKIPLSYDHTVQKKFKEFFITMLNETNEKKSLNILIMIA